MRPAASLEPEHDPFGIAAAVARASLDRGGSYRLLAHAFDLVVSAVAISPVAWIPAAMALPLFFPGRLFVWVLALGAFGWATGFVVSMFRLDETSGPDVPDTEARSRRVIVIGAGPVGLAVVKECLALGHDVVCLERQEGVGGVYRYNTRFPGGVWENVRLTTSPWVTAFADFPPEDSSFEHLHHRDYCAYLEAYATHFGLLEHVRTGHCVERAEWTSDERWEVSAVDDRTGETVGFQAEHLVVCSGLNLQPKGIHLPGQESFRGEVHHVSTYQGPEDFADSDVLVVGIGESGADIAAELSEVARVRLSMQRGKFIIPRMNPLNGVANDYDTNRARYATPVAVRNAFMLFKRRLCFHSGDIDPASAVRAQLLEVSEAGPMSQTVTKNDDIIPKILDGSLELRRAITAFDGNCVVYEDGFSEQADHVLFAHGYAPSFPFLELPEGVGRLHPGLLHLNMFHPELGDKLCFCGFARPALGSIPPAGELQARYLAMLIAGQRSLPDKQRMWVEIARQQLASSETFPTQALPHVVISWIPYMDRLAGLIGCQPLPWRLLLRPLLLWKVATGPMTGAVYRLHGPGESARAEQTVRSLPRMHQLRELLTHVGLHFWCWPYSMLHRSAVWRSSSTIL